MSRAHQVFTVALIAAAASPALAEGLIERWGRESGCECRRCRVEAIEGLTGWSADLLRWNPGTGEDRANFPPDRAADIQSIDLRIEIDDMNTPRFRAGATILFTPVGRPLATLRLNAEQLDIRRVASATTDNVLARTAAVDAADLTRDLQPGAAPQPWPPALIGNARELIFSHDGSMLTVTFDPPLPPGEPAAIQVHYEVHDPADGLFWTPQSPAWPGRAAQIHTQGQPETNRYWFPSHDFPNDRLTTSITAVVPAGFQVVSNGRLEFSQTIGDKAMFKWVQADPHVAYLVSFIVGKFDVVDVAPEGSRLPMPVYVPPGRGEDARRTYANTAAMNQVFERRFDEPYPWAQYAQTVVHNFGAGGMENTGATTMYDTAVFNAKAMQDGDLDGLIAHELAHQWFGDLITCNSWEHIWLNEGFATYGEALWFEARDGIDGYLFDMYQNVRGVSASDQLAPVASGSEPRFDRPPMVSNLYKLPFETFRRTSNPYPKGASILHMLREKLGDELFFRALAAYVDRFRQRPVETDDFRKVVEEVSGLSLERFFHQWCARPGTPKVQVGATWDADRKELTLIVEQKQRVDAAHPAFVFDLPIDVYTGGDMLVSTRIPVNASRHERTVALPGEPTMLAIDPRMSVLMTPELKAPVSWLRAQLREGPTVVTRLDAARWLRGHDQPATREALLAAIKSEGEHFAVKQLAAESLGKLKAGDVLAELLSTGVPDARVRLAVINALADAGGPRALELIAEAAADESESDACREAALEHLGRLGNAEHLPVFKSGLAASSQHDRVRAGALRGLARLDLKQAIDLALPFTQPGWNSRLRPTAIETVARLAHHDRERVIKLIAPLLNDREERTVRAAGQALVDAEHRDGIKPLEDLLATARTDEMRDRARAWRDALAARLARGDDAQGTRRDVERLEREVEQLKRKLEEEKR